MKASVGHFKTFPEFSKLTLEDKDAYEALIKNYPPVGDISFQDVMTWWNSLSNMSVSVLNGNLVIPYWLPGDDAHAGLSLIGTNKVDESICTILDYLRERGERVRLVNVPEFVVDSIRYKELFKYKSSRADDEYIMSLERLGTLEQIPGYRRAKIRRFVNSIGIENIKVKNIDLHSFVNRDLLLTAANSWPRKGINNIGKAEKEVLFTTVPRAALLGVEGIGLYINRELQAYVLYHRPQRSVYVNIDHARVNYDFPYIFDYMTYAFSKFMFDKGATYINLHADMGAPHLRVIKLSLHPVNFFRKYVIEPS